MSKSLSHRYKNMSEKLFAFLFSLPAFLLYTVFLIVPIVFVAYFSLTQWSGVGPIKFVGAGNFIEMFSDLDFITVFKNTGILITLHLLIQIPLAVLFAYLLYSTHEGFRFFRAVYFFPTVISATVIGVMFSVLLNGDTGPVDILLRKLGLNRFALNWLSDKRLVVITVSMTLVWQYMGYQMSVLLAGMQSISTETVESSVIDGANGWQICLRVLLPQMKPVLQVSILFCFTGCLKAFEHSFIMTFGGPGVASSFLAVEMYKSAYLTSRMGYGSAIAAVIIVSGFLLSRILNFTLKDRG